MYGYSTIFTRYESAMTAFTRSLELLRENRYVDYKQVGLNYQLYSCEVSTNITENLPMRLIM